VKGETASHPVLDLSRRDLCSAAALSFARRGKNDVQSQKSAVQLNGERGRPRLGGRNRTTLRPSKEREEKKQNHITNEETEDDVESPQVGGGSGKVRGSVTGDHIVVEQPTLRRPSFPHVRKCLLYSFRDSHAFIFASEPRAKPHVRWGKKRDAGIPGRVGGPSWKIAGRRAVSNEREATRCIRSNGSETGKTRADRNSKRRGKKTENAARRETSPGTKRLVEGLAKITGLSLERAIAS